MSRTPRSLPLPRRVVRVAVRPVPVVLLLVMLAGCAGTDDAATASSEGPGDRVTIVATTNVLGDVTREVVGDAAEVSALMPPGSDPHTFEPSARQIAELQEADLVVANGAGLEQNLENGLREAEAAGVSVLRAMDHVEARSFDDHAGDEHVAEEYDGHDHAAPEHASEDHTGDAAHDPGTDDHASEAGEHAAGAASGEAHADHDDGPVDPHFWTDPLRTAEAARAIGDRAAELSADGAGIEASTDAYVARLEELDVTIRELLSAIPGQERKLVTNHDAFAYFADRYDFTVVGTVIPATSTGAEPSAADLEALAETLRSEDVAAVFTESTASGQLAEVLAAEVGDRVQVVELYSGSLGEDSEAASYIDVMRTNAERIRTALGG